MTGSKESDTITKEDIRSIANIIKDQLYLYVNHDSCIIRPYESEYEFRVKVYGLDDFVIIKKYKAYPRGGS